MGVSVVHGIDPARIHHIYIVNKEGGESLLSIQYRQMSVDPDLVASFVIAVVLYEGSNLRTFVKEDYLVIIEEGELVVGILILDRVENEDDYRVVLKSTIKEFEKRFRNNFENWHGDIRPFRDFALEILAVFPYIKIDEDLVPRVNSQDVSSLMYIPWNVETTHQKLQTVSGFINGKRTVAEIAASVDIPRDHTLALLSMLFKYGWISFIRPLTEKSILVKQAEPSERLKVAYGDQLSLIMSQIDGKRTFAEVCANTPFDSFTVRTLVQRLIDQDIIGFAD